MKIVLAGECMMARPWSRYGHPGFAGVMDRMRAGDVTYAHLETVIGSTADLEGPKSADWTGSYLIAPPSVADELARAGVDLVSAASNHSFEFGTSGIRSTRAHCEAAGMACAGIGTDLEEARAPVYAEAPDGRVALVALSTGNKAYEVAGQRKGTIAARAGIFALWLLAILAGLATLGLFVTNALFVVAYMRLEARERWSLVLAMSACTTAFLYLVFERLLHIPWPQTLLGSLAPALQVIPGV